MNDSEDATSNEDVIYAWKNWCHHLASTLSGHATIDALDTQGGNTAVLMESMEKQWLRMWMYGLEDFEHLSTTCNDCALAVQRMAVSLDVEVHWSIYWQRLGMQEISVQWEAVVEGIGQIAKLVQVSK